MTLSELIKHVGDDKVEFQNIMQSSPDLRVASKDGKITFCTDKSKVNDLMRQAALGSQGDWVGFVVWMPTKLLPSQPQQNGGGV